MIALRACNWRAKSASGPTARDYVQDGLVAMWDGIENAGWGVHDDGATVWKDVVGSYDMTISTGGTWSKNSFVSNPSYMQTANIGRDIDGILTIECRCKVNSAGNGRAVIGFDSKPTSNVISASRYVVYRANGTVNFTGRGSFFTGAGLGVAASYTGVFQSSGGVDISDGYMDGVAQTISPSGGYGFGYNAPSVSQFSGYKLDGEIYSVRIYSRALTAAEIAANYAVDRARFNLA